MHKPTWNPPPRNRKPAYGDVPLQLLLWSVNRDAFTYRDACAGLDIGYSTARRAVAKLEELGLLVDVGRTPKGVLWTGCLTWDRG